MLNERTIQILHDHIDSKGRVFYQMVYHDQSTIYHSEKQQKSLIYGILHKAHYNEIFVIQGCPNKDIVATDEIYSFTKNLRHELNKSKNHALNLRIKGDLEPIDAQNRKNSATQKQTEILNSAKALLKKAARFPWSIFSGVKSNPDPDTLSAKKVLKNLNEIKRRSSAIQKLSFRIVILCLIELLILAFPLSLAPFILTGAMLLSAALVCTLTSETNAKIATTNKLSEDFVDPSLVQIAPPAVAPQATRVNDTPTLTLIPENSNSLAPTAVLTEAASLKSVSASI